MDNSIQSSAGRAMMTAQIQAYKMSSAKAAPSPDTKEGPAVAGASPAFKISISDEGKSKLAETKNAVSAADIAEKVEGNTGDTDLITGDASAQEKASFAKVEGVEDGINNANGVVRRTLDDFKTQEERTNNLTSYSEADLRTMESSGDVTKAEVEEELTKRDEGTLDDKEVQEKDKKEQINQAMQERINAYNYQMNFSISRSGVA